MNLVTPLYTTLDYTNFSAAALTGSGTKIVTDTSPTINTSLQINSGSATALKIYSDAGTTLKFCVDGTTGSVGILNGSPSSVILGANNLVISDGSQSIDQGITIYTATNKSGFIGFTDSGSALQGFLQYDHSADKLTLSAASTAVSITIDSASGFVSANSTSNTNLSNTNPSSLRLYNTDSTANNFSSIDFNRSGLVTMGRIACVNLDHTSSSEDSSFQILTRNAGTLASVVTISNKGELLLPDIDPPTANYANRNSFVKAWGYISSGGSISNSYNISSVSHPATGVYTITFNTAFTGTTAYSAVASVSSLGPYFASVNQSSSTQCTVSIYSDAGVATNVDFKLIAIGDQ